MSWSKTKGYMRPGDRVKMKDGKILTVKYLEYTDFIAVEQVGYVPKRNIHSIWVDHLAAANVIGVNSIWVDHDKKGS